jgi:hypothetical protein
MVEQPLAAVSQKPTKTIISLIISWHPGKEKLSLEKTIM